MNPRPNATPIPPNSAFLPILPHENAKIAMKNCAFSLSAIGGEDPGVRGLLLLLDGLTRLTATISRLYAIQRDMERNDPSKNQRDFFRIIKISTSLAFGTLAAFLYSMKDIIHDPTLVFSVGTVISFVVGAIVGWFLWSFVEKRAKEKR